METALLKIDALRRCLRRVREVASRDQTLADQDIQDIVVLNLQRACEQAIDLANLACAAKGLGVPRTSAEVFDFLEQGKLIEPSIQMAMRKMVGFRNIAVHEYRKLDPVILRAIVSNRLGDFESFVAACAVIFGIQVT